MKKAEIKVGGHYLAKVTGKVVTVRVDAIREIEGVKYPIGGVGSYGPKRTIRGETCYDVTNLATGRKTVFRSAAKFRGAVPHTTGLSVGPLGGLTTQEGEQCPDPQQPPPVPDTTESTATPVSPSVPVSALTTNPPSSPAAAAAPLAAPEGKQCSDPITGSTDTKGRSGTTADESSDTQGKKSISTSTSSGTGGIGSDPSTNAPVPPVGNAGGGLGGSGLAGRIAATRAKREPGTPVAGMTPNEEQEAILAAAVERGLQVLVVGAGAGTGKTATLKMLEQMLPGRGQYTAFNANLVAEGKTKFVKAACNTTHSLAFRAVGKLYQHRLGGERMRSSQVARVLGIEPFTVTLKDQGKPDDNGNATDKVKVLQADFLAGQVLVAVRRFCQSADREVGAQHLRNIDGIDVPPDHGNNERVRDYLLPFCKKAWADLSQINGQLPFSHDCYVKIWSLGVGNDRPIIAADYILLDEAQDTAPVFLDILQQQLHALLVFVGDDNQQIYEWRGAVNAMRAFPNATRQLLTQSYRFGQAIADVANAVLATLEDPTDLVMRGNPTVASRVEVVAEPRCYLYRTNAGALSRVMSAIGEGKKPHLIGGKNYVADMMTWCQAAMDLQARRGTRHPELCCFDSWNEVVEYSKTDEGSDLKLMVKLVDEFGAQSIRDALRDMPKEEDADVVVSTAHKSKGREWDTVRLGADFPLANKMNDADRRLLYVAATRAKQVLDITECPPFCGGDDKAWGEGGSETRWVPGIEITYAQPTSSQGVAQQTTESENSARKEVDSPDTSRYNGGVRGQEIKTKETTVTATCTYTKLRSGDWGLRATSEIKTGQTVMVTTKAGERRTETVGRIVWSGNGVWLATKGGDGNGHGRSSGTRPVCAECGKPGYLIEDDEDGLMKHKGCCDMPSE